jgi:hypothetical protein
MLIKDRKNFTWGLFLAISFAVVLVIMFSPIFKGEDALRAADRLFNSIAKGSTNYFAELAERNDRYMYTQFKATLRLPEKEISSKARTLLTQAGVTTSGGDGSLMATGYLGQLTHAALVDAEAMFNNQGKKLTEKYGYPGKETLFVWWKVFIALEKELKRLKRFEEAAFLADVVKKGIEVGYNFYGIEPQKASARAFILSFSLVFYVLYTLWWGMAIYLLFEGFGMQMKAGAKKEV